MPPADPPEPDLHHHGDRDAIPGALDFAVNVHPDGPPAWLADAIAAADLRAYPDATGARDALAAHHGMDPATILPTAGAAEAFTLLARAWAHRRWLVVHPQFTEPEAALRLAGAAVHRHLLTPADGFTLDSERLHADACAHGCDVVMIGNPTNPTGVLHPIPALRRLAEAGLQVVVDEAFLDATPDASLLDTDAVVIRSCTKIWAIPGVRAGWLHAPAAVTAELARFQTPWSVSSPAIAAMTAIASERADKEAARRVAGIRHARGDLAARLLDIGLPPADTHPARPTPAPFVLVNTGLVASPRGALAEAGLAVRRGESFPGLSTAWIRLAVRTPPDHARLAEALGRLTEPIRQNGAR